MSVPQPVLKLQPQVGRRASLQNCLLTELLIDKDYQRSLENKSSVALIRRIAQGWDWTLCQPLVVSQRTDGLYVVDGQHRLAAARLRGDINDLPCVINSYASLSLEAASFVAINKQRRALNAMDTFRAALAAGDEAAIAAAELMADAGLSLAPHPNYVSWKPGMIYCAHTVQSGYKRYGRLVASSALCALSEAFDGQILQFAGKILDGLFQFYAAELREGAFDADTFITELGRYPQAEWASRCLSHIAVHGGSRTAAMRAVFTDAYLDALHQALAA